MKRLSSSFTFWCCQIGQLPLVLLVAALALPLFTWRVCAEKPEIIGQTNLVQFYGVWAVAFSPDNKSLAFGLDGGPAGGYARFWNLSSGTLFGRTMRIANVDPFVFSLAFSGARSWLVAGGVEGSMCVFSSVDGRFVSRLSFSGDFGAFGEVNFAPDGQTLVSASGDGQVVLWNLGQEVVDPPMQYFWYDPNGALAAKFSPDGGSIGLGFGEGRAVIWRTSDGAVLHTFSGHSGPVTAVAFSPDGQRFLTASGDGTVRITRLADESVERVLQNGAPIWRMVLGPEGKSLMTLDGEAFRPGSEVKFWRVADGKLLRTFDTETDETVSLAISPDGTKFAYGRDDGTLVLAQMPLWMSEFGQTNGLVSLQWQGGTGLYQLQQTANLTNALWQNVGVATTNLAANLPTTSPATFFRIQSLTNAP